MNDDLDLSDPADVDECHVGDERYPQCLLGMHVAVATDSAGSEPLPYSPMAKMTEDSVAELMSRNESTRVPEWQRNGQELLALEGYELFVWCELIMSQSCVTTIGLGCIFCWSYWCCLRWCWFDCCLAIKTTNARVG